MTQDTGRRMYVYIVYENVMKLELLSVHISFIVLFTFNLLNNECYDFSLKNYYSICIYSVCNDGMLS